MTTKLVKPAVGMKVRTQQGEIGKIVRVYTSLVVVEIAKGKMLKQILVSPKALYRWRSRSSSTK